MDHVAPALKAPLAAWLRLVFVATSADDLRAWRSALHAGRRQPKASILMGELGLGPPRPLWDPVSANPDARCCPCGVGVASGRMQPARPGKGGWVPDLTEQGIHPNPGPEFLLRSRAARRARARAKARRRKEKLAERRSQPLPARRPVAARTQDGRERLLQELHLFLSTRGGLGLHQLLDRDPLDVAAINKILVLFGQSLWTSLRPYGQYAETINAVVAKRPLLRRQLGAAWDLAHSWLAMEPGGHHTAMPRPVLSALVVLALLWGWPRVGSLLALGYTAILRSGELLGARRRDLVLPRDVGAYVSYILVIIRDPKTMLTGARIQSSRVEPRDVVGLVDAVYGDAAGGEFLWPASPATFRNRFRGLCGYLGVPTASDTNGAGGGDQDGRGLDLGSLRAGAATQLWLDTEDPVLVQRRGRWACSRTMNIYLQEVAATTFFPQLPREVRDSIATLARWAPAVVDQATKWLQQGVPPRDWPTLWPQALAQCNRPKTNMPC